MLTWYRQASVLALAALVTACGGGNGDGASNSGGSTAAAGAPAPAAAPAPAPAPAPAAATAPFAPTGLAASYAVKTYNFSWNPSAGATSYDLYEDPDGTGPQAATRVATGITGNSYSLALPVLLNERVAAQYTVRACNSAGCSADAVPVQPDVLKAVGVFQSGNSSGTPPSVSLSRDGLTLVVGDTSDSSNASGIDGNAADTSVQRAGAVHVFAKVNGSWVQQAYIKPPTTPAANTAFGLAVAVSADGSTLAVSSANESVNPPVVAGVQIYTRSGGTWTRQGAVLGSNTEAGDRFGVSLAISQDGNTLAVGADAESSATRTINGDGSDNSAPQSGAAYVFARAGGTWTQQAYVKASNADAQDAFGAAVALSGDGNRLVVGAPGERSNAKGVDGDQTNNSVRSGAAYVFQRAGSAWAQAHYLKASNPGSSRTFGNQVAISADGSTIAVGAPTERSASRGINGSTASSPESASTGVGSGAAWVFVATDTSWQQQAYVKASNGDQFDNFGCSISLSDDGNVLAVGAFQESSAAVGIDGSQDNANAGAGSGAAYLFRRAGTSWSQTAYFKALTTVAAGNFAKALSLAGNGASLAVGARGLTYLY